MKGAQIRCPTSVKAINTSCLFFRSQLSPPIETIKRGPRKGYNHCCYIYIFIRHGPSLDLIASGPTNFDKIQMQTVHS